MAPTTRSAKAQQTKKTKKPEKAVTSDTTGTELATTWPQYKDDLPNAFNGIVDPQLDFISNMPPEILDHIASYLLLDHDPERDIRAKDNLEPRPHAFLSFAAMSRKMYYSTEAACQRLIHANEAKLQPRREPKEEGHRRSLRIAAIAQTGKIQHPVYRCELLGRSVYRCFACGSYRSTRAVMANYLFACNGCAKSYLNPGGILSLTEALEKYDLRDFQLLKSRQPGPRAKPVDHIPAILYTIQRSGIGYPIYTTVTKYLFRHQDVKRVASLVHGDFKKHMESKNAQKDERREKSRRERIGKALLAHHEGSVKTSSGEAAKYHSKRLKRYQTDTWNEKTFRHQMDAEESGLICYACGDVLERPGLSKTPCDSCYEGYVDRRWNAYLDKLRKEREEANREAD